MSDVNCDDSHDWAAMIPTVTYVSEETFNWLQARLAEPPRVSEELKRLFEAEPFDD